MNNFRISYCERDNDGSFKRAVGWVNNVDLARISMFGNEVVTIENEACIMTYLDKTGRVEFTPHSKLYS